MERRQRRRGGAFTSLRASSTSRISTIAWGRPKPAHGEATWKSISTCGTAHAGWCDPVVTQVLQQIAPPFPPGSRLLLADGTQAVVTQSGAVDPFKPIVRRISGEELKLDGDPIDLGMHRGTPKIVAIGRTRVDPYLPVAA